MSMRDVWCRLVEEVSLISSTESLPKEFTPTDYLPGGVKLSAELLQCVRAGAAAFEEESAGLFCSQMTAEEGYLAAPSVAGHGAFSSLFARQPDKGEGKRDGENLRMARHEGPDFLEAYRAHVDGSAAATLATVGTTTAKGNGGVNPLSSTSTGATTAGSRVSGSLGSAARLASGFLLPEYYSRNHRQPDFIPIILVPASVSSLLQLFNIREFLERGVYVDPPTLFVDAETGAVNVQESKPDTVIIHPGSFLDAEKYTVAYNVFRVVDDPRQVKNWQHVCACIVDGNEWQFCGWFPDEPAPVPVSELFQRVCGFLPYFEEEKLPTALQQWHVKPLPLTRRVVKSHAHILQASVFWDHLYTFLEMHPFFKLYTVPLD